MKLNFLKPAALAVTMALAACTTTKVVEVPVNQNGLTLGQGEDVISISLSSSTRAARPIGSSESGHNVNRLAFTFLSVNDQQPAEGFMLEGVIDDENQNDESFGILDRNVLQLPNNYDGSEIKIKFSGLETGSYKIIAYGYNVSDGDEEKFPYNITPAGSNYLLQCDGVDHVQEIFAGCNTNTDFVVVNEHQKFETVPVIELKRQVAGLMAYLGNVPVYVSNQKVKTITISSKANVTGFYLPAVLAGKPQYNGIETDDWVATDWVDYLTFDMQQASNYSNGNLNSDSTYEFDDNGYLLAAETAPITDLKCAEDTLFGSCFLLAFPRYNDFNIGTPQCATLNICYWNTDGELILSVPLKDPEETGDELDDPSYQYGIQCNNFYSIGTKDSVDGETGTDQPLDIDEATGYDHAEVSIDDQWTQEHGLIN